MAILYNTDLDHLTPVLKTHWQLNIDNTSNLIDGNEASPAGGGNDLIAAGSGNDRIYANGGNDLISGGAGNDTESGGFGNDTFFFEPKSGNDVITDFHHSTGDMDQIVVNGHYIKSTSSFLGTTLLFDYADSDGNFDGKADASVLLLGVSAKQWSKDLGDGALIDSWTETGHPHSHAADVSHVAGLVPDFIV